ncbi:MAG TPA: hypothetical protein VFF68_07325, partial [Anaerolineaceae bacterium]|nr:hypothetical protein [Anaerolineaceae bacterium]
MTTAAASLARRHKPFKWGRFFLYLFLIAAAIFFLMPIYMLVVTGFKSYQDVSMADMWSLPSVFSLESFLKAWLGSSEEGYRGLSGNFINSVLLTIPAALTSAVIGSLNGYALSKWKFKGSNVIFALMLFGMFIPYQSVLIPLVRVLQWISTFTGPVIGAVTHLPAPDALAWLPTWAGQMIPGYGTIGGLILVHAIYGIPIATLTFRNYYATI